MTTNGILLSNDTPDHNALLWTCVVFESKARIHSRHRTSPDTSSEHSYPKSFILRHFYQTAESTKSITQKADIYKALCIIPYSPQSVSIARTLRNYGIKTMYNNSPNLGNMIRNPLTKNQPNIPINRKEAIYSISCNNCNSKYVGETGKKVLIE
ncbi:hypothetical protein LAZ67_15000232 [Cordylochernes scorpioides]|uniref:Uncharacterized protein n=1 Tax=Cordylochernes scorpioides TaxID=51811 RepID=A0ABY6LCQ2_9ARAC|nr:hypothetical protein LAZ67_15000232 [Cordylochernes scorpioides]